MAQQLGIDYSFSRPPAATIAADGYSFVFRYLASDASKRLSASEATSLHNAGLTIGLVFEDYPNPLNNNPSLDAYHGGVSDANLAVGQANALGVPADRPIYVAVDTDPSSIINSPALLPAADIISYFQGWCDTIGKSRVGLYGGGTMFSYLLNNNVLSTYFWQASAASWSNYEVPYGGAIVLQGLGNPISGYSTDPDTAYISDFGQWPAPSAPPPPASGGTITANVGYSAAGYSQPEQQTLITPTEAYDKVIYSVTTTDATLATGSHNGFYQIPSNVNQQAYPVGTFSYDGGTTFNDFGFSLAQIPGSSGVYPGVQIQAAVYSDGRIVFSGTNSTASTVNLIINVALVASYNPSTVPVSTTTLAQNVSYTNIYPKLTSDATTRIYSTYRRIAKDSNTGTGSSITIPHGQGVVPNIMFFITDTAKTYTTVNAIGWASNGSLGALGIKMDSTNLYFHVDGATYGDCFYRVYKDN